MSTRKFSAFELDQVREIINIGAGNAYTSLSKLLRRPLKMNVPEAFVASMPKLQQQIGHSKERVLAVLLKTKGELSGSMLIVLHQPGALNLTKLLTKKAKSDIERLNSDEMSAFKEIGNIILGTAVSTFSKFLEIQSQHSIPDVTIDMLGAIMDSVILETGKDLENVLAIKIKIEVENEPITGEIYFLFDQHASSTLIRKTQAILNGK